ncbi:ABC transporter ATP-binding protein [Candidatus Bipolaricaulota bacterium]|nr:ABC transporter ATP-binding protein [Candidatus Bipolaricaulota bacterium]
MNEGELVATIGPNGAGKTTLLRTISGVIPPDRGSITLNENDITALDPEDTIRLGMSFVPQDNNIFPSLTVRENLEMGAYTLKGDFNDRIEEICEIFPQLRERMGQKAGTMSGGQQQMVAVGRGMLIRPKILLLDEPTAGLQPSLVKMMLSKVEEINDLGVAVLLVAQTVDAVRLAKRAYLLSAGEMVLSGETGEMLETDRVKDLYFGG